MAKSAEFFLEFEAKHVLVLEPLGPYYDDAIKRLNEQPDLQVVECASFKELIALGRKIAVCLIVAHCQDESQAAQFVSLLRGLRREIRERRVRVVITVSSGFAFLQPKYIREGATEVIEQPCRSKRLCSKIDSYLDILPCRDRYGQLLPPKSRLRKTGKGLSNAPEIKWTYPLNFKSDCWMVVEGKTRWVPGARKWFANMIGPPPLYGEWTQSDPIPVNVVSSHPLEDEPTWEWIPYGLTDDPFINEEGTWKFRGEEPEFKDGAWSFQGQYPNLAFVQQGENLGSKIQGDPQTLTIAEDSEAGHAAAELIEQSMREGVRIVAKRAAGSITAGVEAEIENLGKTIVLEEPTYLRRMSVERRVTSSQVNLAVNPVAAAYLVSELALKGGFSNERILEKLCEYLRLASGGGTIEFWFSTPSGWKSIQHDDLMDMALQQKIESIKRKNLVRTADYRAALIGEASNRIGAFVFAKGNTDIFTDRELEGFARVVADFLLCLKQDAAVA